MIREITRIMVPVIIMVGTLALICRIGQVQAIPKTWIVDDDGPADFHTIQEAIDAASLGDTISVKAGTYNENVKVNKQLTLIGDGAEVTFIKAADSNKHVMNVSSSNVVVSGFNVSGSTAVDPIYGSGIRLTSVSNVSLLHNYASHNLYGIYLEYSNNNTIVDNYISSNHWGINLENNDCYNTIMGNNASLNNNYGIVIWASSSNNTVTGNTVSKNGRGITLGYSEHNIIASNNISENLIGVEIQQVSNVNTVYHNNIIDNDAQAGGNKMPESMNKWDDGFPSGGNYWNDYNSLDFNYDGIYDAPYTIAANNTDNWPLAGLFHIYNITHIEPGFMLTLVSSSAVSNFNVAVGIEHPEDRIVVLNVAGTSGYGFCTLCIPKNLLSPPYTVSIDYGQTPIVHYNGALFDNGTHRWIYFEYLHSEHQVIIAPEFPSFATLSLFMTASVMAAVAYNKKRAHAGNKKHLT
jgi:parallel beta-helix repeat protein